MKITNRQLRQIIREELALEVKAAIPVKTVSPEDYNPPAHLDAEGPRASEVPQAQVGKFFMRSASAGMPRRGYRSLKKQKIFYMILPDEEAIRINFPGDPSHEIGTVKAGEDYLRALDAGVTVLPVSDLQNPTADDVQNIQSMQRDIMQVAQSFGASLSETVQLSHAGLRRRSTPGNDDRDPLAVKRSAVTSMGSAFARARTAAADLRSLGQNVDELVAIIDAAEEALGDLNIRI
jgi:hypothetical protein